MNGSLFNRLLREAAQRADIAFPLLFVLVVGMLILPLPTVLIDVLLAINLSLSLLILISSTYLRRVLDMSTFPTILLLTTVFRLALTVSTARLVLGRGDAGLIIKGFGNFVVGGNVVVGLVIFIIIAIVQFVVITKGAERVAEVSARFTLDAMPGKQMSIDSDFRNGEITKEEARARRFQLERESQFFGAMDGSMRFVKGDAIAAMLVVFINLVGGLLIGVFQRGMKFGDAGRLYSLLTVGDGLVAQIPAMFLAVAAGAIVTRVVTEDSRDLSADLTRQLSAEPKALGIAGAVMVVLAFVPGFPTPVFLTLASVLGVSAFFLARAKTRKAAEAAARLGADKSAEPKAATLRDAGFGDAFVVRIAPDALAALEAHGLPAKLDEGRRRFSRKIGYRPPSIGFERKAGARGAVMEVDGVPVGRLELAEPLDEAAASAFADSLYALQARNSARAFGMLEGAQWLESLKPKYGRLAAETTQHVPLLRMVEVIRRLLEEDVSLAQPRILLEALLRHASREEDPEAAAERIRAHLSRQICHACVAADGTLPAIVAGGDIDQYFMRAAAPGLRTADDDRTSSLILEQVQAQLEGARKMGFRPAILASAQSRRPLRQLLVSQKIRAPVLSFGELAAEFRVRPLGAIQLIAAPLDAAV